MFEFLKVLMLQNPRSVLHDKLIAIHGSSAIAPVFFHVKRVSLVGCIVKIYSLVLCQIKYKYIFQSWVVQPMVVVRGSWLLKISFLI